MIRLRPQLPLLLWLIAIAFLGFQATKVESHLEEPNFTLETGEAATALKLEEDHFRTGIDFPILLEGPTEQSLATSKELLKYFSRLKGGRAFSNNFGDGRILVLGTVGRSQSEALTAAREVRNLVGEVVVPPVSAHVTGEATISLGLQEATLDELRKGELIALPILLLILLVVFRSVIAALIPVLFGGLAVIGGFGVISVLARFMPLDALALSLASMVGLALGVDYSLLMVSRFREELDRGSSIEEAGEVARRVTGRTVVIAGAALLLAMATAALLSPGSFITSTTIGVGAVTVVGVVSARMVMPSVLTTLGRRIDLLKLPRKRSEEGLGRGNRLLDAALRHPYRVALPILVGLLIAAYPAIQLNAQAPGPTILPADSQPRKDFEKIEHLLGPGWAAPFVLVAAAQENSLLNGGRIIALGHLQQQLERESAIDQTYGPQNVLVLERVDPLWSVETELRELTQKVKRGQNQVSRIDQALLAAADRTNQLQHALARLNERRKRDRSPSELQSIHQASAATADRIISDARTIKERLFQLTAFRPRLQSGASRLFEGMWTFPYVVPQLRTGNFGIEYQDEARRVESAYFAIQRFEKQIGSAASNPQPLEQKLERIVRKARKLAVLTGKDANAAARSAENLAEDITKTSLATTSYRQRMERLAGPLALARLQLDMSQQLVWSLAASNVKSLRKEVKGPQAHAVNSILNVNEGSDAARLVVVGSSVPGGEGSEALSSLLQARAVGIAANLDAEAAVGGQGQMLLDLSNAVKQRLPYILLGLSLVTWLVLSFAFRAILAPLIAVALNVLTVGVAFGALVLLYQGDPAPLEEPGYISVIAALVVLGVTFGLSIDYEVFLLSRIREEWDRTGDISQGINEAVRRTSRVIVGAAFVMVGVFLSFCVTGFPANQQLGVGLTLAILLDATVIRLLLLPALLKACGPAAWWWPRLEPRYRRSTRTQTPS